MGAFEEGMKKGRNWRPTQPELWQLGKAAQCGALFADLQGQDIARLLYCRIKGLNPDWARINSGEVEAFWRFALGTGSDGSTIGDPAFARGFCAGILGKSKPKKKEFPTEICLHVPAHPYYGDGRDFQLVQRGLGNVNPELLDVHEVANLLRQLADDLVDNMEAENRPEMIETNKGFGPRP
jgi:hypothetical protein